MDFVKIATQVIEKLGGKENISALAHCATRLRIVLKDESAVDKEAIENIDGVKGQFSVAGQYQIIFGSGTVNKVHAEMSSMLGMGDMTKSDVAAAGAQNQNLLQRLVKGLADIFVPIIPAIVAGGLLMGLANVFMAKDLFVEGMSLVDTHPELGDLAAMINTFANAPFVFLPILIAFSATRKFGGNPFLGAALGMLLVHPDLVNGWNYTSVVAEGKLAYWNIFGFSIERVGYQGSVLPVLVASWILATLEKALRKVVPSVLDNLLTPLLALFIAGLLTFSFVGPITREVGFLLGAGLTWLYDTAGFIGGALFGALYAPIVITGMHQTFIAIETQLLADFATTGGTFIFPIAAMSNIAQGAACLAVFVIMKDVKTRGIALPSGISALLGITEPAMFGVNLRYRYPFIGAMVGAGCASAFVALFNVKAQALGAAGLPGIISIKPNDISMYVIGMLISFVVAFSVTVILGKRAQKKQQAN
ncbi:sucrose-specific PTS transporter subunit IIBC [Testudinibacter sp. TR-2022]|uniref:sucrose-specific PTS transporter subunit IIBC n=1 Tax=Testudinibacter sp. TR-2022 TaxID=2585029 RepID=UPI00111B2AA0|nr:sucrose-specific PTS transporter subunit IIBC [Testudinibacter sp. TR-2022]TNH08324.1 PTS maltose transporter subunit IIBC [Pasteurellaceae bacterium Phil11]TNH25398.1 PTS maltose transporter subunit IIBC [Testudinibacter sp. TR-2022]TNH27527.1 PTS maltose transporter subunit IIBC [Testudinibacter sp. TR-2022]